jgi:HEAT repeat protein
MLYIYGAHITLQDIPALSYLAQEGEDYEKWAVAEHLIYSHSRPDRAPLVEAIPVLRTLLAEDDRRIVNRALAALAGSGEHGLPVILEAVMSDRPLLRNGAVIPLLAYGPAAEPAVPVLLEMLEERSGAGVDRFHVIVVLGNIGSEAAVPALEAVASDEKDSLRSVARRALEKIRSRKQAAEGE